MSFLVCSYKGQSQNPKCVVMCVFTKLLQHYTPNHIIFYLIAHAWVTTQPKKRTRLKSYVCVIIIIFHENNVIN
jgi:hypothetical protein